MKDILVVIMIVIMMGMDNSRLFENKKEFFIDSRLYGLLSLIVIFLFFSCNKESKTNSSIENSKKGISVNNALLRDSLPISMNLKSKKTTGFNVFGHNYMSYPLEFNNESVKDSIIVKNLPKLPYGQVIHYLFLSEIDGKLKSYNYYYFIAKDAYELCFEFNKGDIYLKKGKGATNVDDLFKDYNQLKNKIRKAKESNKKNFEKKLNSLFKFYQKKYVSKEKESLSKLNKLNYITTLQIISPFDNRVEEYIMKLKEPIPCAPYKELSYLYVKNRLMSFDFNKLNILYHSSQYIDFLSLGIHTYLKNNKGSQNYAVIFKWFKKTDFYNQNKNKIDKNVSTLDKESFTEGLKAFNLRSLSFNELTFSDLIKQNPSEYYLIDFWATWCAPCINDIKLMKGLMLPDNIRVISLSVDKMKVKDKWQAKSKELELNISNLVDNKKENKDFIKMIGLNAIPRYILIDRDFNLIDASFLHPSDPDFLKELKELK